MVLCTGSTPVQAQIAIMLFICKNKEKMSKDSTKEQNMDRLVIITAITFVVSFTAMIALPIVLSDFHVTVNVTVEYALAVISVISFLGMIITLAMYN